MFKDNAKTQSYSLGINGGSATSNYSISFLGYLSQEGIVGGEDVSNYERYNFRINTEHKLYKDVPEGRSTCQFVYVKIQE